MIKTKCANILSLFSGSQWSLSVTTNSTISIQNVSPKLVTPRFGAILGIAKIPQIITPSGPSITQPLFKIEPCFIQINYQFYHFIFHDFDIFLRKVIPRTVATMLLVVKNRGGRKSMMWFVFSDHTFLCGVKVIFWGKAPDHLLNMICAHFNG